ncbi:MAG: tRNA preQ1(34) S-adenosylmethionine ribosyltransferase-isomerase QueA [Proteobacteria bacterium]|nr:tRNA preQ1(34) S-adenosylmethionine ribosyltransferase-isomerase QueA [Pseudomonadota bacterium]
MDLGDWDFELPPEAIARRPSSERTGSRLLCLPKEGGELRHGDFSELPSLLREGDLLVGNDTRVMAARLAARRHTGGKVELLVLSFDGDQAVALGRNLRRVKAGDVLTLDGGGEVRVEELFGDGRVRVSFSSDPVAIMDAQGRMPLPPYMNRDADAEDRERYQTVYAGPLGAAAAPTAGLHFDAAMIDTLDKVGVGFARVTLHVGLGTFKPLEERQLQTKQLHSERYAIPELTAARIAETRARGGRVIAVGTTTTRALQASTPAGATAPQPGAGSTELFLSPPDRLHAIDGLITNFHLPKSSLLMLVACLVGRERLLSTYREAIREGYRFYSYGDAMLIL